jgi:thiamine-phosphate pyrophosphorylase
MPSFETYLISPLLDAPEMQRGLLLQAAAVLKPVSVLLQLPHADERSQVNFVKDIAPALQELGAAVLVDSSAQVAVRSGADGVHVRAPGHIAEARETLKSDRIVGASGLRSRHDAMDAGEAGADYVLFGEPRPDGSTMLLSALVERAGWWAELFETPCVAYAPDIDAILALAHTKAEFIALGPWCLGAPGAAAARIAEARAGLTAGAA